MADMNLSSTPASASDWAFDQLFRGILAGEITDRMRLTEATLSEQIGVSRTPLRDALQRLEMAGIVSRMRNRSIRINPPSLEEMERLSMLREVLEGLLVRRVAIGHAHGEIQLTRLREIVQQMTAVEDHTSITLQLRLGQEFHAEIASLAGDPLAARMLQQVMLSFERYRHLVDNLHQRGPQIAAEHRAVLEAIVTSSPEEAEARMRQHLATARALYTDCLTQADFQLKPKNQGMERAK